MILKKIFQLTNNAVFRKAMKKARKDRDIKLTTNDAKINNLLPEPKYHTEILVINIY